MDNQFLDNIAIVIPSYNPDESTVMLIQQINAIYPAPIIVVDDGSRPETQAIFDRIKQFANAVVLKHNVNLGKGRALKSAFNYYLSEFESNLGVVTADADGQHAPEDIFKCIYQLQANPGHLILGVRNFSQFDVPWKSRLGNNATRRVMSSLTGVKISDTQTGLRGIPGSFMKNLINLHGERFEFETGMLLEAQKLNIPISEVTIQTIYDNANRGTHFRPTLDSLKIYRLIFRHALVQLFKFLCSGVFSALVDLGFFSLFYYQLCREFQTGRLLAAVVLARLISLTVNYLTNKLLVFREHSKRLFNAKSFGKYLLLCAVIMFASYFLTKFVGRFFNDRALLLIKCGVDVTLFFSSFLLQKHLVFKRS